MNRKTFALVLTSGLSCLAQDRFREPPDTETRGKPMSAEETVASMTLPPGFKVNVWAAEPIVLQPIHITTDGRGRLWVAENFTYCGSRDGWFDMGLRDRIAVLADTDGDGAADQRTVFWDRAQRLTSVEVGHGGVWALCPPNLLFLPDRDGDDLPDGSPEVVLDGFATTDIGHTIANGLQWGPDGWLWGRQGIQETSSLGTPGTPEGDRVHINVGIWRMHPLTRKVEAVCHGGTNPWGMDFDERGAGFFVNTVIGHLFEVLPGAHYERMYGVHLRRSVPEYLPMIADHYHWDHDGGKWNEVGRVGNSKTDALGGGHAHIGCLIYQGDNWPEQYRGRLFTANLHGRRINVERLERDGITHVAKHEDDFLKVGDPWFRGMELRTLPDGSVLLSDWSDTGECHDHDGVHRSSGRVYRIAYHGEDGSIAPAKVPAFNLAKADMATLWRWHERPNRWWARAVRHELQQRAVAAGPLNEKALDAWLPPSRTGGAWQTLLSLGEVRPEFRAFAKTPEPKPASNLLEATRKLQAELQAGRYPYGPGQPAPARASARAKKFATQLLWLNDNPSGQGWPLRDDEPGLEEIGQIADVGVILRWTARARGLEIIPSWLALKERFATVSPHLLQGIHDALRPMPKTEPPTEWPALKSRLEALRSPAIDSLLPKLAVIFGDGQAAEALLRLAKDPNEDVDTRRQSLISLAERKTPGLAKELEFMLDDRVLASAAVRSLALCDAPKTGDWLLPRLLKFDPPTRRDAVSILTSRPAWANLILLNIEDGYLPRSILLAQDVRKILALNLEHFQRRVSRIWGQYTETPEARRKEIEDWKRKLTPEFLAKGGLDAGKALFASHCASCHRMKGEGLNVGPDLTGGGRANLDYLLENIITPNAVVPKDFEASLVSLKDGRSLLGIVQRPDDRAVKILMPGTAMEFPASELGEIKPLGQSLMPEGIAASLSPEQFRDLLHYLMTP